MRTRIICGCVLLAGSLGAGMLMAQAARPVGSIRPRTAATAPALRSVLPAVAESETLLESTPRCRDWAGVPYGSSVLLAFIVYPERPDKAPVVFVSAKHEGFSPWVRAVSDQIAADGVIAVAGDVLTNMGPNGGDSESFGSPEARNAAM